MRESLAALDETNTPATVPKAISLTDPASTWTAAGGLAIYAYSNNYLIDLKAGIIVDVEASPANKGAEDNAKRGLSRVYAVRLRCIIVHSEVFLSPQA